jgi:F-type H+-transporting ATPase subunit b
MTEKIKNRLTSVVSALSTLCPAQAFAAGGREPSGLPQLDIATWPSQLFWLVVLFGAGYLVMAKIVTPRIGAVLEERRNTLDADLEKARNASADAAKIRADYESDLENARNEAAEYAKQAAAEAAKKADAADAKTAQKLANKIAKAEAKLAQSKSSALGNLNDVAAGAAINTVAALTGIEISSSQAGRVAASVAKKLARQERN